MAIDKVRQYLKKYNLEDRIIEFTTSSATVALAAEALGCEPGRIAKSMSFWLDEVCILVVCAGDTKINNQKYREYFNKKAKMLSHDEVEKVVGHDIGGVCPFALNKGVKVYLDESLKTYDTVYPAAGSSNSTVRLTLSELTKCVDGFCGWVDVCKIS